MLSKKLKRTLAAALAAVMVLTLGACGGGGGSGAGNEDSDMGETMAKIQERGTIIMGVNATYAPFEFHADVDGKDTIVGFDIELGKAIAEELGVELEVKDMAFDGLLPALAAGKVDILPGLAETEERAQNASFSIPYHRSVQVVVCRKTDAKEFTSEATLEGKTIGILKGSVQETTFPKHYPKAEMYQLGKIPDLILALKNGKIDGVMLDQAVAILYSNANDDLMASDAKYELSVEEDPGSSVLVRKNGNEDLLEAINTVLERVMNDGTLWQWELDAIELMGADPAALEQ